MHEKILVDQNRIDPAEYIEHYAFDYHDQPAPIEGEYVKSADSKHASSDWHEITDHYWTDQISEPSYVIAEPVANVTEQDTYQKMAQYIIGKVSLKTTVELESSTVLDGTYYITDLDTWQERTLYTEPKNWDTPVESGLPLPEEVKRQGEYVKVAPNFSEQVHDDTRTAPIEYVYGTRIAHGTDTEDLSSTTLSEQESIAELQSFLVKMAQSNIGQEFGGEGIAGQAKSMLENMTFIGKQEYDEATQGIAEKWGDYLRNNPNAQICAIVGQITPGMVKSDAYLLDNILKNFSDEQLNEFSGRLVLDPSDLTAEPDDIKIVMLDDWTISGSQLKQASRKIIGQYPQYKDQIEIQLIAATEQRIIDGLNVKPIDWSFSGTDLETTVPVNAYFAAHAAPKEYARYSQAHITGAHCAVDFDFNNAIAAMADEGNIDMPPATNIVRPYRKNGVRLVQSDRLRGLPVHMSETSEKY